MTFTRYGVVDCTLGSLGRDAITNEKLKPVYEARIVLRQTVTFVDGRSERLQRAPSANAAIKIDRRVTDYLLSAF
jgi:hypothetical protein